MAIIILNRHIECLGNTMICLADNKRAVSQPFYYDTATEQNEFQLLKINIRDSE